MEDFIVTEKQVEEHFEMERKRVAHGCKIG